MSKWLQTLGSALEKLDDGASQALRQTLTAAPPGDARRRLFHSDDTNNNNSDDSNSEDDEEYDDEYDDDYEEEEEEYGDADDGEDEEDYVGDEIEAGKDDDLNVQRDISGDNIKEGKEGSQTQTTYEHGAPATLISDMSLPSKASAELAASSSSSSASVSLMPQVDEEPFLVLDEAQALSSSVSEASTYIDTSTDVQDPGRTGSSANAFYFVPLEEICSSCRQGSYSLVGYSTPWLCAKD
jgi:hypothetical protein